MSGSSCRPVRLVRFEGTAHAMSDGVRFRVNRLADALEAYVASCRGPYRAATQGTDDVVDAWRTGLRDLGTWTGDVGRAFIRADAVERFTESDGTAADHRARAIEDFLPGRNPPFRDDPEAIVTFSDRTVRSFLPPSQQAYRGVPTGTAARLASGLDEALDQDGPPAWISHLNTGGTYADIAGNLTDAAAEALAKVSPTATVRIELDPDFVAVFRNGGAIDAYARNHLQARLRLPTASSTRLTNAAKWLGRASAAAAFTTSAHGQWTADAHLPTDDRLVRSATRGGFVAGGSALAGAGGFAVAAATIAPLCGPAALLCAAGGGIAAGFAGGFAGNEVADALPHMKSIDRERTEHSLRALADEVANRDGDRVAPEIAASVDLAASHLARLEAGSEPTVRAAVESLLPDPARLRNVATGLPKVSLPTGTTTTTVTLPPPATGPLPDPWPSPRPHE